MSKRAQILFFILGGFFIVNAVVAELVGGKLFSIPMPDLALRFAHWIGYSGDEFVMSSGILIWPVVFIATDLVNEFFGRKGVRFYTFVTVGLIIYTFFVLYFTRSVPAVAFSPVSQEAFDAVFGTSQWIIFGSIVAFVVSQLLDVFVFHTIRTATGGHIFWLWARATGSTVVSQLIDTFIVGGIGLYLPGKITLEQFIQLSVVGYIFKVGVAILSTPFCYMGHAAIEVFLGREEAQRLAEKAAREGPGVLGM